MIQRSKWVGGALVCLFIPLGLLSGCALTTQPDLTATWTAPAAPPTGQVAFLQAGALWLYHEQTHQTTSVLSADPGVIQVPTFLPDGSGVLYIQQNQSYYEMWLYQLATQTTEFVTAVPAAPQHVVIAPNSQFVLLTVDDTLFLIDLDAKTQTRIHEGVIDYSWSPKSRRLIYQTTGGSLLSRSFAVTGVLEEPEILLEQAIRSPIFLSDQVVLFEGQTEAGQYTVMQYDLATGAQSAVTSLDFDEVASSVVLRLSPNGTELIYARALTGENTFATWLIYLSKDAPRLLLQEPTVPVWSEDGSALYYVTAEQKLYTIATTGLNKILISPVGTEVTTTFNRASNDITL